MSAPFAPGRWLAIAASVLVVATVVVAIAVMGTPGAQRQARLDDRRAADLAAIERAVDAYARQHGVLPPALATLQKTRRGLRIVDPEHGAHYGYAVTGRQTYRLCAVFATDTAADPDFRAHNEEWSHGIGRQCFDRNTRRE